MTAARPTPFALLFGALAPERFPLLRSALAAAGCRPEDRDGFILVREVVELLRELRPDEGMGEAVQALVALVHYAYLFWSSGEPVRVISEAELAQLVEQPALPTSRLPDQPPARAPDVPTRYVQLPALRVWATPVAGQPAEPLDGWFETRAGDRVSLLALFGLSPTREGLTAVELAGPRAGALERRDGKLFAPLLAGGDAAGLLSLAGEEELLELAWRVGADR